MPSTPPISYAVEGTADAAAIRKILASLGLKAGDEYIKNGKSGIDRSIAAYNNAARSLPWIVLRDLNGDAPCAPELIGRMLQKPAKHMYLRIAVRAIESWLLADDVSLANFLRVPRKKIPENPDSIAHPKEAMVTLARSSSRRATIQAMVPRPGSGISVGPEYVATLLEFIEKEWSPKRAANSKRSPSLTRSYESLKAIGSKKFY